MQKTVLLVEDDPDMREELAWLIEDWGYSVVTAGGGHEALAVLSTMDPPCLAILDLMMPHMDGWQLRAALLEQPSLASVPVVLLSGVADLEAQAKTMDVVGYLTKPFDIDELSGLLAAHC